MPEKQSNTRAGEERTHAEIQKLREEIEGLARQLLANKESKALSPSVKKNNAKSQQDQ